MAALALTEADLNGECFIVGAEGEREERLGHRIVYRESRNVPANPAMISTDAAGAQDREWARRTLAMNYANLVAPAVGLDPAIARKVAYLRFQGIRNGWFDFTNGHVAHHARYTETHEAESAVADIPDWNDDRDWRNTVRQKVTDIVCLIAYFFRVRGHHWTGDMDDRYKDIWRKCLYNEDTPGLEWEQLAHHTFHAIYPDDLDRIWQESCETGRCAGALIKRFHSSPAGIAGVAALNAGVNDLQLVIPQAFVYMPDAIAHLDDVTRLTTGPANRWNGSVNRRFYDAQQVYVNESLLGQLAALIMSTLDQFAITSPLRRSEALKRIASNAPITGSVVARMVRVAVSSDAAAETFLPRPALPPQAP